MRRIIGIIEGRCQQDYSGTLPRVHGSRMTVNLDVERCEVSIVVPKEDWGFAKSVSGLRRCRACHIGFSAWGRR
jgi:hypothetical protein